MPQASAPSPVVSTPSSLLPLAPNDPSPASKPFLPAQEISQAVLQEKYLKGDETGAQDIFQRVARSLAEIEKPALRPVWARHFLDNLNAGAIGAGRIMSAAGTQIQSTLINCFVQPVGDCIQGVDDEGYPGIYEALREAAETMRRGGGVGYDFSRIRPKGAKVKGTHSMASGPCSYINVFDQSCSTVESAGARRGAQMGVLRIDHPDVLEFITAKRTPGRWNNFNVSVGVTDAFMAAVESDGPWDLVHAAEPSADLMQAGAHRADGRWVYRTVRARDLWDTIMKSAYDFAEPGILFLDQINTDNNLHYTESIQATNPCVAEGTLVSTPSGYLPVEVIKAGDTIATIDGVGQVQTVEVHENVDVFDVELSDGSCIRATAAHIFHVEQGAQFSTETRLDQLRVRDKLRLAPAVMPEVRSVSPLAAWSEGEFGLLVGAALGGGVGLGGGRRLKIACATGSVEWKGLLHDLLLKAGPAYIWELSDQLDVVTSEAAVAYWRLAGLSIGNPSVSTLPLSLLNSNSGFLAGFIDGMVSSSGHVYCSKRCPRVQVAGSPQNLLMLKRALSFFGIMARISSKVSGLLEIKGNNIRTLVANIGITRPELRGPLKELVQRDFLPGGAWIAQIRSITPAGKARVFDLYEPKTDTWITDGVVNRGCGEQPLPPYGCCDLGPIILTRFVHNPFGFHGEPAFDFEAFARVVAIQVRMLDNVLEATFWPLEQQRGESAAKRRIGVGFTGLGNALAMLRLRYDRAEGRDMAVKIAECMRDSAYRASIELAKEKGAFPLFEAEGYLAKGTFASRLPLDIQQGIREHGIRNSHLLSIAPTGTVSLAFADNASNGIEPPFSWTYTRKKREQDGSTSEHIVEDYAWRLYRSMGGDVTALPDYFVNALAMSAQEHVAMMEAVQPFIDTAISKTVNIPADYDYEDFKSLYMHAWKARLKGLATYRPNAILGAVLQAPVKEDAPAAAPAAPPEPAAPPVDPMRAVIEHRPDGALDAVVEKLEYWTHEGRKRLYLIVSFLPVPDGKGGVVERAVEFFMPVGQSNESQQWITSSMRLLSLSARGGFLAQALSDMRKVVWDRGPVRLGTSAKADGTRIPLWHDSETAALAYAIQNLIEQRAQKMKEQLVLALDDGSAQPAPSAQPSASPSSPGAAVPVMAGKKCWECGAHAVIRKDGCDYCTQCGAVGSCG